MGFNDSNIRFNDDDDRAAVLCALIKWYADKYEVPFDCTLDEAVVDIATTTSNGLIVDAEEVVTAS
jgi:hypothetical protein